MPKPGLLLVAAILASGACRVSPPPPVHIGGGRDLIANQHRINRYFHKAVVPSLRPCWGKLQGTGTVDVEFVYKRAGSDWVWDRLRVAGSTPIAS